MRAETPYGRHMREQRVVTERGRYPVERSGWWIVAACVVFAVLVGVLGRG